MRREEEEQPRGGRTGAEIPGPDPPGRTGSLPGERGPGPEDPGTLSPQHLAPEEGQSAPTGDGG